MCGVRFGTVAVLLPVPFGTDRDLATVVRAMRGAGPASGRVLPGLSARHHRDRAGTVRIRRADPSRDPSFEVRGVARRRGCAGGRDDRDVGRHPVDAQRRHVGAAVPRATRGARLRSGPGTRAGDRAQVGRTRPPARAAARGPGTAGPPRGGLAAGGDARGVRGRGRLGPCRARRRCAHHGRHRGSVCHRAARGWGRVGGAAHGRPGGVLGPAAPAYTRPRARVRVCGCPGERIPGSRCQPRAKRPT
jgi:hypothetical protein